MHRSSHRLTLSNYKSRKKLREISIVMTRNSSVVDNSRRRVQRFRGTWILLTDRLIKEKLQLSIEVVESVVFTTKRMLTQILMTKKSTKEFQKKCKIIKDSLRIWLNFLTITLLFLEMFRIISIYKMHWLRLRRVESQTNKLDTRKSHLQGSKLIRYLIITTREPWKLLMPMEVEEQLPLIQIKKWSMVSM